MVAEFIARSTFQTQLKHVQIVEQAEKTASEFAKREELANKNYRQAASGAEEKISATSSSQDK